MAGVKVRGLREMNRAFARANRDLDRELKDTLKDAAEPVREGAERLAFTQIRGMVHSPRWAEQKIGATSRVVYIAPRQRGTKNPLRRRPNLAGLLLGRAMEPALRQNEHRVVAKLERMLDRIGRRWER